MPQTPTAAAQYLRMSTDQQQFSIENQKAAIQRYADEHGFLVTSTYEDAGKSGLALKHRLGLRKLLQDVLRGGVPYRAILVYDVSRWGRFQDIDEAAHYEFLCKRANVPVHYCAEPFTNDGTMAGLILKSLKRVMAGEYSRELSARVTDAMRRMTLRGLRGGAMPGFAFRRLLVSAEGKRKQFLKDGEQKNIKSDHVILVPGPKNEVACVRDIYRMFTVERKSATRIAHDLSVAGLTNRGKSWNNQSIMRVLTHEKYIGSMVWGRWTQRLHTRSVPVPREKWTILPDAFAPIVDKVTFEAVKKRLRDHFQIRPNSELLEEVRSVLKKEGKLSARILNASRITPSSTVFRKRFGSLDAVYKLVGYKPQVIALRKKTFREMDHLHNKLVRRLKEIFLREMSIVRAWPGKRTKIRFRDGVTVNIVICRSERTLRGAIRWRFQTPSAKRHGSSVLLCFCNNKNDRLMSFHILPNLDNIRVVSLLKKDDVRLATGKRVHRLRDLRRVLSEIG